MQGYREVKRVVPAMPTTDGAGVHLRRSLGSPALDMLDPFLLLDEFHTDDPNEYIAGFPDHPHRGFETVTQLLAGAFEHKDHLGNTGHLGPGSVQWMTAGRGIVHSEMPLQEDGLVWGFQLWVNLPADQKMAAPRYQDIPGQQVAEIERDDGTLVRIIAGEVDGVRGPIMASPPIRSTSTSACPPAPSLTSRCRRGTRPLPTSTRGRGASAARRARGAGRSAPGSSPSSTAGRACGARPRPRGCASC